MTVSPPGLTRALVLALAAALPLARTCAGDTARLLDDPREAMLARAELIENARTEVLAQAFIFGDDRITLGFLALLRDAARRGVSVSLLADAQWNAIPTLVQAHLIAEGVAIREYHPFRPDRLYWITRRMHDKMLVGDGRHLLLGGRNIESPYFDDGETVGRRDYMDCDIVLDTAESARAREHFLALWDGGHVRRVRYSRHDEDRERAARRLDDARGWLLEQLAAWRAQPAVWPVATVQVDSVRLLHDHGSRKGLDPGVAEEILALLASARTSVVAESPYMVPSRPLKRTLGQLRARDVEVRILTNSLATTDNLWPQAAYAGDKKDLVRGGIELWEYRGPESLHAKTAVIDGHVSLVGSFNLDPRSEKLNTELAVIVLSDELARQLTASMDGHLARAWRMDANGRPEGEVERYPGVSGCKVARMRLRRLVVPFVRGQL